MARRSQSKTPAATPAGDQGPSVVADQHAAANTDPAAGAPPPAATSSDGGAESMVSADGQADLSASNAQPAAGADSVSTSVAQEPAFDIQSGAGSVHSPDGPAGDDNIAGGAGDDSLNTSADLPTDALLGGDGAPSAELFSIGWDPLIIAGVEIPREDVIDLVIDLVDLTWAEFEAYPESLRAQACDLVIASARIAAENALKIKTLFAAPADGLVDVTAKSADGQPFRRAGHVWTEKFETHPVAADLVAVIEADPNLIVKAAG